LDGRWSADDMRDVLGKNFYGSFWGRFGRGSGEAHFVSDTKIKNACQCQWGQKMGSKWSKEAQKGAFHGGIRLEMGK